MERLSRKNQNLNGKNENIFNCKDIKLQLLILYQTVYWGIVIILKMIPLEIEPDLKNHIIIILSSISAILILAFVFDVLAKSKYKWTGVLILLLTSTIMLLCKYII